MTPQRAGIVLQRVAESLTQSEVAIGYQTVGDIQITARRWSSGPYSLAELAKRDHPYATRHGRPRLNPARINVQTGVFRDSWRGGLKTTAKGVVAEGYNIDPKAAQFLEPGTARMFARPIDAAVMRECAPRAEKRVQRALEKALGKIR